LRAWNARKARINKIDRLEFAKLGHYAVDFCVFKRMRVENEKMESPDIASDWNRIDKLL